MAIRRESFEAVIAVSFYEGLFDCIMSSTTCIASALPH